MAESSRTIFDTQMGPYVGVMRSMSRRDKEIVMLLLFEIIAQEVGPEESDVVEEERKKLSEHPFCPENVELAKTVLCK